MNPGYNPIRPFIRSILAAAALAATLATWAIVDGLARGYGVEAMHAVGAPQMASAEPTR